MPLFHGRRAHATFVARSTVVAAAILAATTQVAAQGARDTVSRREPWSRATRADSARLLYKGVGFGSDAYYSPLTVLLNKGFDIFQLRDSPRNFWSFPYDASWDHGIADVFRDVGPIVRRFGGWHRFSAIELYPSSFNTDTWNWLVNYTEHLVGGGVTMRMLDEWYRDRGVPWPRAAAMVTTYAASILNEMTEQAVSPVATAGGVADLLVFDVGAIALFHWKQPTYFLVHTLQIADWSSQATFTYPNRQLQNNGQYLTMKVPIGLARTRLFLRGGMGVQVGLSRKLDDEHHLSVGAGGVTRLRMIDRRGHEVVRFAPAVGVYYDRNNSLLWSVTTSPAENLASVNVYPGVLSGRLGSLGLWGVFTRDNELRFGLVQRRALGLGVGYGR